MRKCLSLLLFMFLCIISARAYNFENNLINKSYDFNHLEVFKEEENKILYQTFVEDIGFQEFSKDGETSGTTGEAKRLEEIRISLNEEYNGNVEYRSFIEDIGFEEKYKKDGETSGIEDKMIEAIQIRLTGEVADEYDIYYRVHVQNFGWLGFAKNGESAGTIGYDYRLEAIEIKLVNKTEKIENEGKSYYQKDIFYRSHIQDVGWQNYVSNGSLSGTTGHSKRIEAIEIKLNNLLYSGNVEYRSYIEGIGFEEEFKKNDEVSGTTGEAKRIEAIQIRLTGDIVDDYDIYYRVHVQNFGWLGWAKNGESAGTIGYGYRLEGIEIKLALKNEEISNDKYAYYSRKIEYSSHISNVGWQDYIFDGKTSGSINQNRQLEAIRINLTEIEYTGSVEYKTLIEGFGWERNFKSNNEVSGTTGQGRHIEALQIRLTGEIAEYYDIYYRAYAEKYGWLGWAKNGEYAGTNGYNYKLEGIQIKLLSKEEPPLESDKDAYIETEAGYYIITSRFDDNKVIDIYNSKLPAGSNVILNNKNEKTSQIWKLKDLKNGYYSITTSLNPDIALSLFGNNVNLSKYRDSDNNLWILKDLGDGYFSIISKSNGLYLDTKDNNIIAASKNDSDSQKFKLVSYTGTKNYKGIDISKWQGLIDWDLLVEDNPEFIIMRVGSGREGNQKDSKFEEYYTNAKSYDIPVGVYTYSFAKNMTEALKEADLTLGWLGGKKLDLPVFYDIENISQTLLGKDVLTKIAETFCERIIQNGYKCGIYANKYFLKDNLDAKALASKYPIWLAHWTGANDYNQVFSNSNTFQTDYNLTPYKYWQFSSLGVYKGITENTVDLDFGYDIFD